MQRSASAIFEAANGFDSIETIFGKFQTLWWNVVKSRRREKAIFFGEKMFFDFLLLLECVHGSLKIFTPVYPSLLQKMCTYYDILNKGLFTEKMF